MKLERRDGAPDGNGPEVKPEKPSGSSRKREISVIIYTTVLFAVALALILLSYAMQKRTNTAINDMSVQHGEFSAQAMRNIEELQNENQALRQKLEATQTLAAALGEEPGPERDKLLKRVEALKEYLGEDMLEIYDSLVKDKK